MAGDETRDDPYLWLEDVTGEDALDWVRGTTTRRWPRSKASASTGCAPRRWRCSTPTPASRTPAAAATICTTTGATPRTRGGCGGARRWTATAPTIPDWDVIIDLDALAAAEDENWVWGGADVIYPERTRAMVSLSRGGVGRRGDARIRHDHTAIRRSTASSCRRPSRAPRGRTRTPCWCAPTSATGR